ncbi:hypothetical protein FACS1894139_04400 [Planctomycetales bacterium]|nr:hypothetical protein FACS1894107_02060 [Planctomycetales bacterium]GHT01973.1 hypothetical protein FACS1894108_15980 [Planctomycetales bacterium]GHT03643.1 hypothetical protein FACS1894139_04400 [Planctomycetales bacterium]
MPTTLTAPRELPATFDDDDDNPVVYPRSKIGEIRRDFFRKCQDAAYAALERGDTKAFDELTAPIPEPAGCAYVYAKMFGKDALLATGADLTLADEKYGEGWLEQFTGETQLDRIFGKGWVDEPAYK